MFWLSILAATLMIFYGLGAGLKYVDAEFGQRMVNDAPQKFLTGQGGVLFKTFKNFIGPAFYDSGYRFQGSMGNPAYVATYLIFAIFYASYLLLSSRKKFSSFINVLLISLIALFSVFFVFAGTRGAFIGLSISLFLGLIFLAYIYKPWRKRLFLFIALAVSLIALIVVFKNSPVIKKVPALRIFDISLSTQTFQDRTYIWRTALIGFKEKPILGWGPENFAAVFDRHYPKELFTPGKPFGAWFDRAHNIFFDRLIEAGALGFLTYLSIFLVFFLQLFKQKNAKSINAFPHREYLIRSILFALPIAYLVQGLVLFEVLVIYLNIFLFFAFVNYKFTQNPASEISKK